MARNALERRIAELVADDGRLDIAEALADLDPEIIEKREVARIEDLLRLLPEWKWEELLGA